MNAREKSCEEELLSKILPTSFSIPNRRSPNFYFRSFCEHRITFEGIFLSGAKGTASDIARRGHCTVFLCLSWGNCKSTLIM